MTVTSCGESHGGSAPLILQILKLGTQEHAVLRSALTCSGSRAHWGRLPGTGWCPKVLIDRVDLTIRHELECRPWHNLKQIVIKRSVEAIVCDSGGAGGVDMINIHTSSHDLREGGECLTANGEPCLIRCQIVRDDFRIGANTE